VWVSANGLSSATLTEINPERDQIIKNRPIPGPINWLAGDRTTLLAD